MPRPYKPVEIHVKPVPGKMLQTRAVCPQCEALETDVLGRLGLRLVFRCQSCRTQFFRNRSIQRQYI